nr:hypothetical protein [Tanacetum cinerariifolium]
MPRPPLMYVIPRLGNQGIDLMRLLLQKSEKYKFKNIFPTSSNIAIHAKVVPKVYDVSLVDEVFDGAFGGDGEEDVVMGEGVVVTSSSLEMLTKSCLGGMMILSFWCVLVVFVVAARRKGVFGLVFSKSEVDRHLISSGGGPISICGLPVLIREPPEIWGRHQQRDFGLKFDKKISKRSDVLICISQIKNAQSTSDEVFKFSRHGVEY